MEHETNRRTFLKTTGAWGAGASLAAWGGPAGHDPAGVSDGRGNVDGHVQDRYDDG